MHQTQNTHINTEILEQTQKCLYNPFQLRANRSAAEIGRAKYHWYYDTPCMLRIGEAKGCESILEGKLNSIPTWNMRQNWSNHSSHWELIVSTLHHGIMVKFCPISGRNKHAIHLWEDQNKINFCTTSLQKSQQTCFHFFTTLLWVDPDQFCIFDWSMASLKVSVLLFNILSGIVLSVCNDMKFETGLLIGSWLPQLTINCINKNLGWIHQIIV